MYGIIWPHGKNRWSCGIHPQMDFHPRVEVDVEWDSTHDLTKFTAAKVRVRKEDALEFLALHNVAFTEVLDLNSPRVPGLARLAAKTVKN